MSDKINSSLGELVITTKRLKFLQSKRFCEKIPGRLVSLKSQKDVDEVSKLLLNYNLNYWRIGLEIQKGDGRWSDGTVYTGVPFLQDLWNRYEERTGCESGVLYPPKMQLMKYSCKKRMPFICIKDSSTSWELFVIASLSSFLLIFIVGFLFYRIKLRRSKRLKSKTEGTSSVEDQNNLEAIKDQPIYSQVKKPKKKPDDVIVSNDVI